MVILNKPKRILSAGMVGSGSTFIFNVAREILTCDSTYPTHALYSDDWQPEFDADSHLLLKCHYGSPSLYAAIQAGGFLPLVTVRHPGDSLCSDMERFRLPFDRALMRVRTSLAFAAALSWIDGARVFRYEDGFMSNLNTAAILAQSLDIPVPQEKLVDVTLKYSAASVRSYAIGLDDRAEVERNIDNDDVWCSTTQIHRNHIGKQVSNRWRNLPADQRAIIAETFREICEPFGYALDG